MNYERTRRFAAAVLAAVLLMTIPACVLAAETAPHVPNTVQAQDTAERLTPFNLKRNGCRGVSVSDYWVRQARINGMLINLRLHTPMGDEVMFREKLDIAPSDYDRLCLYLQASEKSEAITLQLDQPAIKVLKNLGVVEIVVADYDFYVRAHYYVSELEAVRKALGLTDGEQLCVTGEDAPVTVVSEDGVRRQINP